MKKTTKACSMIQKSCISKKYEHLLDQTDTENQILLRRLSPFARILSHLSMGWLLVFAMLSASCGQLDGRIRERLPPSWTAEEAARSLTETKSGFYPELKSSN